MREFMSEIVDKNTGATRRDMLLKATYLDAISPNAKDRMAARELLLNHDLGKPVQAHELSGPEGTPIQTESSTLSPRSMNSEKQLVELNRLLQKASGAADPETSVNAGAAAKP